MCFAFYSTCLKPRQRGGGPCSQELLGRDRAESEVQAAGLRRAVGRGGDGALTL